MFHKMDAMLIWVNVYRMHLELIGYLKWCVFPFRKFDSIKLRYKYYTTFLLLKSCESPHFQLQTIGVLFSLVKKTVNLYLSFQYS